MNRSEPLQADLERRILNGLACEYDASLHFLDGPLRARMVRPLLRLSDLKGRWGQWVPERREICLSRNLAMHYPWGAVREVLRHEMAHQLAGLMAANDHRPHGAAFREACRLLRADPAASANYRALDRRANGPAALPEDRWRLRVQKLFALAESPNPHEAASAMRKARELITRHGDDRPQGAWTEPHISVLIGKPALRHFRDEYLLAQLLIDLYGVAGVWVPAYVLDKGRMGSALEISGRPAQIQVAAYAHDFVGRFIEGCWRQDRKLRNRGRRPLRDFAVGVIEGFRAKTILPAKNPEPPLTTSNAIVAIQDPRLTAYLRHRYPHLRNFRREGGRIDPTAYGAGLEQGRHLMIREGIGGSDFSVDTQPAIAYFSR